MLSFCFCFFKVVIGIIILWIRSILCDVLFIWSLKKWYLYYLCTVGMITSECNTQRENRKKNVWKDRMEVEERKEGDQVFSLTTIHLIRLLVFRSSFQLQAIYYWNIVTFNGRAGLGYCYRCIISTNSIWASNHYYSQYQNTLL